MATLGSAQQKTSFRQTFDRNLTEISVRFVRVRMQFDNEAGRTIIADAIAMDESQVPEQARPKTNKSGQLDFGVCAGQITIKGPDDANEMAGGQTYLLAGKWTQYTNKRSGKVEHQFTFSSFIREEPTSREAVVSYLAQHGEGKNLGKVRCQALWNAFGTDAIRILREEPQRAVDALNAANLTWWIEQAEVVSARLKADEKTERTKLDLVQLLNGRGFPKATTKTAIQTWGVRAPSIIRRDPYRLMQFRGCGFKRCDAMYLDLKLNPARMKRQALSAWYAVARDTEGHTWYPMTYPSAFIKGNVSGCDVNVEKAIQLACRAKMLSEERTAGHQGPISLGGQNRWFAEHVKAEHEKQIADAVIRSMAEKVIWPDVSTIQSITEHQREHLAKALASPICIFGGSPGTGKTFTIGSLVRSLIDVVGIENIAIGAPTGKAAVRVTENLVSRGIPLRARTWHSMLNEIERLEDIEAKENGFRTSKKFKQKILIGDECFAPGTLVDTPSGPVAIEQLQPGGSILNPIGVDLVVACSKKEVHHVCRIVIGKTEVFVSENHPFLTRRGFVNASELRPGDSVIQTRSAMRLLRCSSQSQEELQIKKVLQSEMQHEMVDAISRVQGTHVHGRTCSQGRSRKKSVSQFRMRASIAANRSYSQIEPYEQPSFSCKSERTIESNETQTTNTRWKRSRINDTTVSIIGSTRRQVAGRIRGEDVPFKDSPNALQDRPGSSRFEDCHRSGRFFARLNQGQRTGSAQGQVLEFERVESVENIQSDDSRLDRFRDSQGKLFFYDIQAAQHPSYSVGGLVVHNCSMLDTTLMAAIMRRRAAGTHLLLVGDVNQLAPVGHGAPLRDMIAAGVAYGELTQIMRNSGGIVEACASIRERKPWAPGDNLLLDHRGTPDLQLEAVFERLSDAATSGLDPIWDVQILVAVNDKSPLARKKLNGLLQAHLNSELGIEGIPFRLNDKIVNCENGWLKVDEERMRMSGWQYEEKQERWVRQTGNAPEEIIETRTNSKSVFVANGELARIISIDPKGFVAELSSPQRFVTVTLYPGGPAKKSQADVADANDTSGVETTETDQVEDNGRSCSFELGYALTCHKLQGSDAPWVIVLLDEYPGARMVCDRNFLYTAISRAKYRCILVGKKTTADRMCLVSNIAQRKTLLRERILARKADEVLAEI